MIKWKRHQKSENQSYRKILVFSGKQHNITSRIEEVDRTQWLRQEHQAKHSRMCEMKVKFGHE